MPGDRERVLGQGQTVVVALPKGAVTVPPPVLEPKPARQPLEEALDPGGLAKGLLVLVLGVAGLLALRLWVGRDRRSPAEAVWPGSGGSARVETSPPDGVRPAHAGLLLNRRVRPEDLSATIVDLAGRGLLSIEGGGKRPWVLRARSYDAPRLAEFERILLQGLFAKGPEVRVRDLRRQRRTLRDVRRSVASEAFERGWFTGRPGMTPWPWWAGAGALAAVGVAVAALVLIPVGGRDRGPRLFDAPPGPRHGPPHGGRPRAALAARGAAA
ncbi:MAG TPA: hypothetical protein VFA92_02040, partial [Candidatus Binatia bacterium]|nr:hypothetical protein [Candidatus Binatia bacterium]